MEKKILGRIFAASIMALVIMMAVTWPVISSAADEKAYSMPAMGPLFSPPPYELRNSWVMIITFKTSPDVLKDLIPKPLVPNPAGIMVASFHRFFASGLGHYNELVLSSPAVFEGKQVLYCVYIMSDNVVSIAAGREIWGWPKKWATVKMDDKEGVLVSTVENNGLTLVRGAMLLSELENQQAPPPPLTYVNLKLIPSVKKDAPPDVMQLTSMPLENYKLHRAYKGKATLEFGTSPADPFHKIPILEVLGGRYTNSDSTLPYGEVIHDYLKAK